MNKYVWWKCQKNKDHIWKTTIASRVIKKSGCHYCTGQLVTKEESFGGKYPKLLKEWDYKKNEVDPYTITEYSHKRIWWKCKKNHKWECQIYNRSLGSDCPMCSKGSFSKLGIIMLDFIAKRDNLEIKHAMNGGEHQIKLKNGKTIKVDGYCKKTNTVYEINGCFFHAHVTRKCSLRRNWDINDDHPYGKTYGERYLDTLQREKDLDELGYDVVSIWECECRKILKGVKIY